VSVPGRFGLAALDDVERAAVLRAAHAQATAWRLLGRRPPWPVLSLERDYQAWRKREQRKAA